MKTKRILASLTALCALSWSLPLAVAGEKWDMPLAYPADNFQTINAGEFATCVKDGTAGAIEIVLHPNGSLFKGNDAG